MGELEPSTEIEVWICQQCEDMNMPCFYITEAGQCSTPEGTDCLWGTGVETNWMIKENNDKWIVNVIKKDV